MYHLIYSSFMFPISRILLIIDCFGRKLWAEVFASRLQIFLSVLKSLLSYRDIGCPNGSYMNWHWYSVVSLLFIVWILRLLETSITIISKLLHGIWKIKNESSLEKFCIWPIAFLVSALSASIPLSSDKRSYFFATWKISFLVGTLSRDVINDELILFLLVFYAFVQ